jgi:hypothetical protein
MVIKMRSVVLALGLVLVACGGDESSSNPFPSATNQGGSNNVDAGDASVAPVDSAGQSCGMKSCNSGEYCCDGKCGACAAIGTLCPAKPCP